LRKIEANRSRDRANNSWLQRHGWHVVRLWETDILKDAYGAAQIVARAVKLCSEERPAGVRAVHATRHSSKSATSRNRPFRDSRGRCVAN
jgi:G:T-mismatch repair DNA endonuclease (very short patch repair protein)